MRRILGLAAAIIAGLLAASCGMPSPEVAHASEPGYASVTHWPRLPASALPGQAVGAAVDSDNRVVLFHRAGRTWVEPFPAASTSLTIPNNMRGFIGISGIFGKFLGRWMA